MDDMEHMLVYLNNKRSIMNESRSKKQHIFDNTNMHFEAYFIKSS